MNLFKTFQGVRTLTDLLWKMEELKFDGSIAVGAFSIKRTSGGRRQHVVCRVSCQVPKDLPMGTLEELLQLEAKTLLADAAKSG